jgi:hypothetical protein
MILNQFKVLSEVQEERRRQDEMFGGAAYDDLHSREDWLLRIDHYVNSANFATQSPAKDYRRELLKTAAVIVAAIESYDRQNQTTGEEIPIATTPLEDGGR